MSKVGDSIRETGDSIRTVFANKPLGRVCLALAGSKIGDWAFATGMTVWVFEEGGATAVGVWYLIRLVLLALLTPFASVLADRFPRRAVMIACDLVRLVIVLICAALIAWSDLPWIVYVLATVAALAGAPFRPAQAALLPSLAHDPTELTAANGANSTFESLSFFVGPAIAGLLLAISGIPEVFVFNALTFVWSATLVAMSGRVEADAAADPVPADGEQSAAVPSLTASETPAERLDTDTDTDEDAPSGPGFAGEAIAGFAEIWRNKDLRLVTWLISAQTIVAGASVVFTVSIAIDMVGLGAKGVGYLDALLGVGAIIGGLVAIGRASRHTMGVDLGIGVVLWSLPLLLVAIAPNTVAAVATMVLLGFANPLVDVNYDTILQRVTPDRVMGRVFGASETALISTMALGSALMPLLIHWIGLRWGLVVIGAGVAAMAVPCFPALRSLDRRLDVPEGLELLLALPLFAPLSRPVVERFARRLERVEVPAGQAIIVEGDVGDRFYIIESGSVVATFGSVELSTAGPGEPFGEIALLRNVARTATVTATEPTVVFALDREDFLAVVIGDADSRRSAEALASRRIPTA